MSEFTQREAPTYIHVKASLTPRGRNTGSVRNREVLHLRVYPERGSYIHPGKVSTHTSGR